MRLAHRVQVVLLSLLTVACPMTEESTGQAQKAPDPLRVLGRLPEFTLSDQDDQSFGSSDLAGKVWVANFIFTRCGSTCPRQTAEMGRLQQDLWSGDESEVRLVSFTVDPEYDTPEVLKQYALNVGADDTRWKFLTGSRSDLRELSKTGFKLPVSDTPDNPTSIITHSQQFILIDRQNRIRGYYGSFDSQQTRALRHDIRSLLAQNLAAGE